ncbi:MAG: 50S ribosomal protein L9 [Legionellales bacterium]|nr:50S ribosomal protein L9 [Legionellales bacterium]
MEVILTKVSKLGNVGDKVMVKGGYARNYLIPTGGAVSTTTKNLAYFEKIRSELEKAADVELKTAQALAKKLETLSLKVAAKISEGGSIFGSIGVIDVLKLINKSHPEIERRQVQLLGGAVREIGEYDVTIQCHRDVVVALKMQVVDIADE